MPLSSGDHLGPYKILALIGKGGMGEVYRAHDPRVNRDVAIKVSDARFTERFTREARAIGGLNHTNICHLYDVGPDYLVMELVEGPDLRGPLDFDEALPIIKQLIDGIEAAHEKNIIHRDLKPANIKITPEGDVKILDFGLAKALEPPPSDDGKPEDSPTLTMGATVAGTILGTAAYMAPEQAKGKAADKRSDIWSFGVIVYEMLTGKRLFQGESAVEILGGVLNKDPDISAAPVRVHKLLRWCLEKDRKQRLASISDARRLLVEDSAAPPAAAAPSRLGLSAWIAAGLFLLTTLGVSFVHFRESPPEQRSVRFQIPPPEKSNIQNFRLSPDGRFLVFTAYDRKLWVRALDSLQANSLPGTDGATGLFWSPDSQFIGFFAQGKLKKISASGGPPQILCDAQDARGGTWNRDGVILFAPTAISGLFTVPAGGGAPVQVIKPGNSISTDSTRYPEFLPDGRHFLYTILGGKTEQSGIYAGSLDGKPSVRLLPDVSNAIYAAAFSSGRGASGRTLGQSGYLLFRRGETLIAQPFDPAQLRMSGDSFPVAERVGESGTSVAFGAFSISENGTLAYGAGTATAFQLAWTDRAGKAMGLFGPPGAYSRFRLAPDDKRIAFDVANQDVWVLDAVRGVTSRLTSNPAFDNAPVWSPDGLRLLFSSNRNGGYDVYTKSASGTGQEELLIKMGTGTGAAVDWSKDGRFVLYQMPVAKTGQDLWIAPQFPGGAAGDRKPFPYLQSQFDEQDGRFSPDGKWVAYVSNESGRDEIYVQSFPVSGAKFQISSGGGTEPQWRNDGTELFYLAADGNLMAVPVKLGSLGSESFQSGPPKPLMPVPSLAGGVTFTRSYAVSNDGQRFLIPSASATGNAPSLTVVLNWQAGLNNGLKK
jgi:eukaryotic-like serine/threonine-protein kinase